MGEMPDPRTAPVEMSLDLADALHRRWTLLLENMQDADFERTLRHPELGVLKLKSVLAGYGLNSRHHVEQIPGNTPPHGLVKRGLF